MIRIIGNQWPILFTFLLERWLCVHSICVKLYFVMTNISNMTLDISTSDEIVAVILFKYCWHWVKHWTTNQSKWTANGIICRRQWSVKLYYWQIKGRLYFTCPHTSRSARKTVSSIPLLRFVFIVAILISFVKFYKLCW